jgi:hypothetical protein
MAARPAFHGGTSRLREMKGKRGERRKKGGDVEVDLWGLLVSDSRAE